MLQDYLRHETADGDDLARFVSQATADLAAAGLSVDSVQMSVEDREAEIWFHGEEDQFRKYGYSDEELENAELYD